MKVVPCEHGLEDILGKSFGPRSAGLHISQIYGSLFEELEPKRYVKGSTPDPLRLEAGLAFESFLEEALKRRLCGERPGEIISDEGIICSPDLIVFNGSTRSGEIKLTWLSNHEVPRKPANSLPPKFAKYVCQMQAYSHVLEIDEAKLICFFVNGDYRPPQPELLAWNITFTAREIAENWAMLIQHAYRKGLLV